MPESTPRFAIPYPVATDPAYMFPIAQEMAQEIDDVLSSISSVIGSSVAGKAEWRPIGWSPSISGVSLGNGVQTAYAYLIGNLVVCGYSLVAAAVSPTTAFSGSVPVMLTLPVTSAGPSHALCTYTAPQFSPPNLLFTATIEPNAAQARINGSVGVGSLCFQNFPITAIGFGTAPWAAGQGFRVVFTYRTTPGAVAPPIWADVISGAPARPGDPDPVTWGNWVIPSFTNWLNVISGTRKP